ncbi:MAG: amino acid adenylation domain-containing protein [Clostridia bacterium]|nr:amino acid adenylation domain-containing protein [Clostridia bacterium]
MFVTFVDAFLEQARLHPEAPAVMDLYGALTYNSLNERSALLARSVLDACHDQGIDVEQLRHEGKNGARIAVLLPRTRDYMAALLGVLRAGCAIVPLDSEYPAERIQTIREDSEFVLFVTTASLLDKTGDAPHILIEEVLDSREKDADLSLNLSSPDIEGLLIYTSGSTGKPKGVVHRQYVFSHYYALNTIAKRPLPRESVHCCIAGFTFIAALFDLTVPIMTGAQVYIANEKERHDVELLYSIIQKRHVTSMFLPPKMFMVMRELYGRLPLRNVEMGGEKADPKFADDGNAFEAYASSETFCMLFQQLSSGDQRRLGKPAAGSKVYLMDDDGSLITKPGIMGELCVVSPWLALGYNKLPEETASRFKDCPFEPGARMYCTGDYMAFDDNGDYLFHGRKDRMIKLRGYRVELGEIENTVRMMEGINEAACVAINVNGGDKLCCYYTGEKTDSQIIKQHAASRLPDYMIPDYMVWIDALPRNERNKVNYLALKAMKPPIDEDTYAAPETEMEQAVCDAFGQALNISLVSATADFFDLGGTSLSVAVLIAALENKISALSFQDVVKHPTPRALAAYLDDLARQKSSAEETKRDFYPLTKTQLGIYLEALTGGNNATYTVPFLIRIDPSVTQDALINAVNAVISAHPSMKYIIRSGADGIPHMFMVPDQKVDIPVVNGTDEDRLSFMENFFPVVPMMDDLLFHFAVYQTEERCYLAAKTHLIFLDGTSVNLLIDDINKALLGQELIPETFTIQQAAIREETLVRAGLHETARQYHAYLFKDMDDIPSMSGDRNGHLTPGVSENMRFEPGTLRTERVQAFCDKNHITESSFFMGAMALMLGKYLNSKHVSFSTVYNGRAQAGMDRTIGTLIKRIPIYGDLSRDMLVGNYLRSIGRQILTNMSHDIYSFDEVLKECPVNEEVEFIYQGSQFTEHTNDSGKPVLAEGDKWFIEHYHTGMVTGFFSIQFFATAGLYNMTIEYRNERFSPEWVNRFANDLFTIAEGLLVKERISEIEMLTDEDRKTLKQFNNTFVPMEFVPVHEQFHLHALKAPDKPAVTAAGKCLTFRELDLLSTQLAFTLQKLGVGPETLVGVLFDREVWAYVAEISILKAGGAFVPFIPDYPDDRIDFCMKDGFIQYLLTTDSQIETRTGLNSDTYRLLSLEALFGVASLDDIQPAPQWSCLPKTGIAPDNLAYCIYTSGTTGRPKGVMIEHRNIANYVHRNEKSPEIMHYALPGRICLALASFSFDVSVVEAFVPLCNGNSVVVATEEEIHTPAMLAKLIRDNCVSGITCTPTYLLSLLDIPDSLEAIRQLTFFDIGAEAFPAQLYTRLRALREDSVILNVYGPTEATMGCAAELMKDSETVTVGTPIANTRFYVSDTFGNELPVNIRGELMICGDQVGRGYIHLPDKTAASFFNHNGMRAYRSGDLAAWTEDGKIRIFGRVDNQIKLHGFRIELDEIESVLMAIPGIKTGTVVVRKNNGAEYLV